MNIFWEELTSGIPDARQFVHVMIRLIAATLLGAVVGMAGDAGQADATSPTVFAYIVATACIWPGTGVLLITRGRTT